MTSLLLALVIDYRLCCADYRLLPQSDRAAAVVPVEEVGMEAAATAGGRSAACEGGRCAVPTARGWFGRLRGPRSWKN